MAKFALLLNFKAVAYIESESKESAAANFDHMVSFYKGAREHFRSMKVQWMELIEDGVYVIDDLTNLYAPKNGVVVGISSTPDTMTINTNELPDDSPLLRTFPRNLPVLRDFLSTVQKDFLAEETRKLEGRKAEMEREKNIGKPMTMKDIEQALGYKFHIVG